MEYLYLFVTVPRVVPALLCAQWNENEKCNGNAYFVIYIHIVKQCLAYICSYI